MVNSITIKCPAKINLALDVLKRRDDGYHEVKMIMTEIPLYDTLTITLGGSGINLSSDCAGLSLGRDNLIYRAAELFFNKTGKPAAAKIYLEKRIPIGAGLAGGSTDAAGTLLGLNMLYGEILTVDELLRLGAVLGADVPFCITKGCAVAEGIGTELSPLPMPPEAIMLLAKPRFSVSTAEVYGALRLDENTIHPDVNTVAEGIIKGDWQTVIAGAGNTLEGVTCKLYPQIDEFKQIMREFGAEYACMSGSGSCVFGVFFDRDKAERAAARLRSYTDEVYVL